MSLRSKLAAGRVVPAGWRGFKGTVGNCELFDILQMACLARQSGCLRVKHRSRRGFVVLQQGRIIHAQTGPISGEDGLVEILCWRGGRFSFTEDRPSLSSSSTIGRPWEQVLMEAVRKRDEKCFRAGPKTFARRSRGLRRELDETLSLELQEEKRRSFFRKLLSMGRVLLLFGIATAMLFPLRHGVFEAFNSWSSSRTGFLAKPFGAALTWRKRSAQSVRISASPFNFQHGEQLSLPDFEIDDVEVPIWQYAEFLQSIGTSKAFDHPDQPVTKRHTNPQWEEYARAAFNFQSFRGTKLTPNHPAAFVDWFDAYAFAAWHGRRLPSEQEWEKAARGTKAWRYPWGDTFRYHSANLFRSANEISGPSPIGSFTADRSVYGIYDTAGNVSEWTGTLQPNGFPVIRGGNFSKEDGDLTQRILGVSAFSHDARIGFRTAK
jgi:Sulfatase-modifying factor enzyme 1/Domain of unknown function (DUF4388)